MEGDARPAIAIVEDELIVALDIRHFLERAGYRVLGVFASGDELIDRFESLEPDLVLMDIKIKGSRDGVDTARVVHERWKTPVILLTAYTDETTVARAKITEPFGYILKPFEERELKTSIELALYRAEMDKRIRASEERFRRLFREGISGNYLVDTEGRFLESNDSFRRILRIEPEAELPGLFAFFPDAAAWESFIAGLRAEGRIESAELDLRGGDGSDVLVLTNAAIVEVDGAELIQGELFDLTERRRLEERLSQSQKMEAIGRLAGGIAHDFNNILTAVMGYATLLADEAKVYPAIREDVEGVRKASARAVELTRQLLAFSRRQPAVPRLLDLDALVKDLEKMLRRLISEEVQLHLSLSSSPALVFADPTQVEQVVINLAVNGRDAMPRGGRLEIGSRTVEFSAAQSLASGALAPGHYVLLSVEDTGLGIPPEIANRIFEPFFTTKPKEQGTGLGLSTVYGIAKQSGGGVTLGSKLGAGARFEVYFPARLDASPEVRPGVDESLPEERGVAHILFVDDDAELCSLASRLLEKRGHRVLAASNAGEALLLAEAQSRPIDLLVTDLVMPFLDGYRLAKRILALHPDMRILYISGFPERALDPEAAGRFLPKPFTESSLVRAVEAALGPLASDRG